MRRRPQSSDLRTESRAGAARSPPAARPAGNRERHLALSRIEAERPYRRSSVHATLVHSAATDDRVSEPGLLSSGAENMWTTEGLPRDGPGLLHRAHRGSEGISHAADGRFL